MNQPESTLLSPFDRAHPGLGELRQDLFVWLGEIVQRLEHLGGPWLNWQQLDIGESSSFLFVYPLVMAYVWMIGALIFYLKHERRGVAAARLETLSSVPVSVLIPCHNEAANIRETIEYLLLQKHGNYEIIAIDDGSTDETWEILEALAGEHPQVRAVRLATNQGKAMALRTGALLANSEYLVCIDADALLDPSAVPWLIRHFESHSRVGAVTGNPRIRTRSTLLGKIQVGEFSAIVGLIKRAQAAYGRIFTVSGVIAAFRRAALHSVDYWSTDMITEDVDISWKLQLAGWKIRFEPRALCWVLMPETLKGLWKQRLRWAQGGAEVLLRYAGRIGSPNAWRLWPLAIEYTLSVIWSYWMAGTLLIGAAGLLLAFPLMDLPLAFGGGVTVLLNLTCLLQFALSLAIDSRYERAHGGTGRFYYWIIWYPFAYWLLSVFTTSYGLIRAITKERGQPARWVCLDRGLRHQVQNDASVDH